MSRPYLSETFRIKKRQALMESRETRTDEHQDLSAGYDGKTIVCRCEYYNSEK